MMLIQVIHVFDTAVLSSKGSVDISHDHTAEFVKETPDPVRVEETDDKVCVVYHNIIAENFQRVHFLHIQLIGHASVRIKPIK